MTQMPAAAIRAVCAAPEYQELRSDMLALLDDLAGHIDRHPGCTERTPLLAQANETIRASRMIMDEPGRSAFLAGALPL